jgi:phosphoadenosine phosphosulfate reductase
VHAQEEQRVRMDFLEEHLAHTLRTVVQKRRSPVFTTALIAGDAVILDTIAKARLLDRIPVVLIDTLHLFPETLDFLRRVEEHYNFRAEVYRPLDCETREQLAEKYGTHELWRDTARYDKICKVEPLQRALARHHSGENERRSCLRF